MNRKVLGVLVILTVFQATMSLITYWPSDATQPIYRPVVAFRPTEIMGIDISDPEAEVDADAFFRNVATLKSSENWMRKLSSLRESTGYGPPQEILDLVQERVDYALILIVVVNSVGNQLVSPST